MENYTLRELFDRLKIPLAELGRRAGISEVTVAKIRDGASARRSSINSLLEVFSELYGIKLSIDNVSGILIKDKLARQEAEKQIVLSSMPYEANEISHPQNRPTMAKKGKSAKTKDTGLPAGAMLATEFARAHNVARETFRDHMLIGLGPGVPWGMGNEMTVEKDHVDYSERPKPGRPKEKERYLTQEQQAAALAFWQRHDVNYSQCDQPGCPC